MRTTSVLLGCLVFVTACAGDDVTGTSPEDAAQTPGTALRDDAAVARSLLLTVNDLAANWQSQARPGEETTFDYSRISGCEVMESILSDESHTAEERSPTFSAGSAQIEQDVRIYPSEAEALAVFGAWTDDNVVPCLDQSLNLTVAETVASGGLGGAEDFTAELRGETDAAEGFSFVLHKGDIVATGSNGETRLFLWSYVMQRDRAVVRLNLSRSGEDFEGQIALIALLAQRFDAAGLG